MRNSLMFLAIVSVSLMAVAGIGFAVTYTATTVSTDNDLTYKANVIDIVDLHGESIGAALEIPGPTYSIVDDRVEVTSNTVWLREYKLKIYAADGDLNVRSWIILNDERSWAMIDNISLVIDDGETSRNTNFLSDGTSSVPSESMLLDSGEYTLTLSITYARVAFDLDEDDGMDFLDLTGSRLVFLVADADPLA